VNPFSSFQGILGSVSSKSAGKIDLELLNLFWSDWIGCDLYCWADWWDGPSGHTVGKFNDEWMWYCWIEQILRENYKAKFRLIFSTIFPLIIFSPTPLWFIHSFFNPNSFDEFIIIFYYHPSKLMNGLSKLKRENRV